MSSLLTINPVHLMVEGFFFFLGWQLANVIFEYLWDGTLSLLGRIFGKELHMGFKKDGS